MAASRTTAERFAALSDRVSELAGYWQHTTFWLVAFVIWLIAGFFMHWSDSWQLWGNTPTTWVELFLGLLVLNSANRVENAMLDVLKEVRTIAAATKQEVDVVKDEVEKGASHG